MTENEANFYRQTKIILKRRLKQISGNSEFVLTEGCGLKKIKAGNEKPKTKTYVALLFVLYF